MLSFGNTIVSSADKLTKISVADVFASITKPKSDVVARIRQLRIAYNVDRKMYDKSKKCLPYLVCGMFNPPFRRTENFAYTEYFFVDIDHIESKGLVIKELRKKVESDNRVLLSFLSPSEDGLKLLFRLKDRCYDPGVYSLFYKVFVQKFSAEYNIEQVTDSRTSDVCRACFISIDANAYYNPNAETVDINAFLPFEDASSMLVVKREIENLEKSAGHQSIDVSISDEPSDEEISRIREILKLKTRPSKKATQIYVPQQLMDVIDDVTKYVESTGLHIYDVVSISYGKKMKLKLNDRLAEINIFYGKKGFTVTITPKNGTDGEFSVLCRDLIGGFLSQL